MEVTYLGCLVLQDEEHLRGDIELEETQNSGSHKDRNSRASEELSKTAVADLSFSTRGSLIGGCP